MFINKVNESKVPRGRGRPPGRTAQGLETRQLLFDTAITLMAERGYAATTLRDVASEAGVSPGLLYRYFPSKQSVVLALYDEPISLDPTVLVQREIRLQGSIAYTSEDFREAVELLSKGIAYVDPLITHRESLDKIGEAFSLQLRKNESIKVLVEP